MIYYQPNNASQTSGAYIFRPEPGVSPIQMKVGLMLIDDCLSRQVTLSLSLCGL